MLNAGSSSLKFQLFKMQNRLSLCSGLLENIAQSSSAVHFQFQKEAYHKQVAIKDHTEALSICFDLLMEYGVIVSLDELSAVAHRVVHGGDRYSQACYIDAEVIEELSRLIPLAPLHNPANLAGILAVRTYSKEIRQIAVFDTAFHQSMPPKAFRYGLRSTLYEEDRIRRYGFHGSSHQYVSQKAASFLNREIGSFNCISLHLGNGASACAVKGGKSMDTSMGMTPLEGLVMGTRSGDVDAGILFYLHEHKGYSMEKIKALLEYNSGLEGICAEHDMRRIIDKAQEGNNYQLALDIFIYRIKKYIGAYMAVLGRVDAIVFTGGIGEHAALIRQKVCEGLEVFGIELDKERNDTQSGVFAFEEEGAPVRLLVVPANEELQIAKEATELLQRV